MRECLEIRRDFDGDVPLRVKRLAKDPGNSLEAKKSGWVQNEDRRPKTQKRRPLQNRLEITLK